MTEMTERERIALDARKTVPTGLYADEWAAVEFVRMHDALMAYDAAQKPAEPSPYRQFADDCNRMRDDGSIQPKPAEPAGPVEAFCAMCGAPSRVGAKAVEPTSPSDPVATVREAMEYAEGRSGFCPSLRQHRKGGLWVPTTQGDSDDRAGAAILNALPALLERAEIGAQLERSKRNPSGVSVAEEFFRTGVIKGLEWARDRLSRDVNRVWRGDDSDLIKKANAAVLACSDISKELARIRNGGPIDGEAGGTTSASAVKEPEHRYQNTPVSSMTAGGTTGGPGDRAGQDRGLTAPDGQTQAGGAPGLPKGWADKKRLDAMRWIEYDNMRERTNIDTKFLRQVTRMARDAIKLREALIEIREQGNPHVMTWAARKADAVLSSLDADHG